MNNRSSLQVAPNETIRPASQNEFAKSASGTSSLSRSHLLDFVQPAQSGVMLRLAQRFWPLYAFLMRRKLDLRISDQTLAAFKSVEQFPTLICPNHSAYEDPGVIFILSTRISQRFRFLAARELFGAKTSLYAKLLQSIGCYSVERAAADANAFKTTRNLLTTCNDKIVIFPEGEITHQNNYIIDLETGPEHMGLSAMADLNKHGKHYDVYILPLVLRYKFSKDMSDSLNDAACKIESALGYDPQSNDLNKRIQSAFLALLDKCRQTADADRSGNIESRIREFRRTLLADVQKFLGSDISETLSDLHRIHLLKNKFAERSWCYERKPVIHFPCKHCPSAKERAIYKKLERATNFLCVGNHCFDHDLSMEESAELLCILQYELFGKATFQRPEIVYVNAAPPISLQDFVGGYETDKKHGIDALKAAVAARLHEYLQVPI